MTAIYHIYIMWFWNQVEFLLQGWIVIIFLRQIIKNRQVYKRFFTEELHAIVAKEKTVCVYLELVKCFVKLLPPIHI